MSSSISFNFTATEDTDTEEELSQMLEDFVYNMSKEKEKAETNCTRQEPQTEQSNVILLYFYPTHKKELRVKRFYIFTKIGYTISSWPS